MGCCPTKSRVETRESAVGELLERVTHISAGCLFVFFRNEIYKDIFIVSNSYYIDIHETITMVKAEKERKTGSNISPIFKINRKSKSSSSSGQISEEETLPKISTSSSSSDPTETTPGTSSLISISESEPENPPHVQKGGKERYSLEFSDYAKEIEAVVEDLEIAPKRRSVRLFNFHAKISCDFQM